MRALILMFIFLGEIAMAETQTAPWIAEIQRFRADTEASLKKTWLVVVGLDWLKQGENTIGGAHTHIDLPDTVPGLLAKIHLKDREAEIEFNTVQNVYIDGKKAELKRRYPLATDKTGSPTTVKVGTVEFFLIDRPNGIGVRSKDSDASTLKNFQGLPWWEPQQNFVLTGRWKTIQPRTLRVPDILGNMNDEIITGSVTFTYQGKTHELFPTRDGDKLFFVFKDASSGKSSYGPGRFLKAQVQKDGRVVMDFNRAYNPPCAHIRFATCPLPPRENVLAFAIEAGEKAPAKNH